MDDMNFLNGEELEKKIANTEENDRSLVRYDRKTKDFVFPECEKCGAPRIIHRDDDFANCESKPSNEEKEVMINMLKKSKGIEKFNLKDGDDDIDKYGNKIRKAEKRPRGDEMDEEMPSGKKIDEKVTPTKYLGDFEDDTKNEDELEHCEVIEVFTVTEHMDSVRKSSEEEINNLNALINSLDSSDKSNMSTIAQIRAQIAQIKISRDQAICSMNNLQSNASSDIKIEKQRFCPAWTEGLKYEPFKKQLENWSKRNKNDEATQYYEVLESLKKNDKIPGLSEYVAGTVCEQFKEEDEPTIAKLIKYLDNKYLRTAFERVGDFLKDLDDFRDKQEKDPAKFFEKIEYLSKKFVEEKLNENPNFFFMCLLMKQGRSNNLLSETDYIMLKKVITTSEGDMNGNNDKLLDDTKN